VKAQGSIGIGAPPEKVWPFLVEPERILKWYTLLRKFEYTSEQHAGAGATVYMEEAAGVSLKVSYLVTEWVENEKLAFRMTSGNFVKGYEQTWSLEPTPRGSRFTLAEDVTMPYGPVGRVLGAFSRSSSARHVKEILAQLKALAEAEVVPAPALVAELTAGPEPVSAAAPVIEEAPAVAVPAVAAAEVAAATATEEAPPATPDVRKSSGLRDIERIGPAYGEKLEAVGLKTTDDLLHAGATPKGREDLVASTGISRKLILRWVNMADLFRIQGVGEQYSDLLEAAGVDTVPELAQRRADNLTKKMAEVNEQKRLVRRLPTENEVTGWVESARGLPRVVTY
jgi:predicted flap endonuclease-1-like 5' DNA nuclease/uncharacterized protein YndB with AHSA1/START domain